MQINFIPEKLRRLEIPGRVDIVNGHGHLPLIAPGTDPAAGERNQLLDHRRAEHLQEEIFVGLPIAPKRLGMRLGLHAVIFQSQRVSVNSHTCQFWLALLIEGERFDECPRLRVAPGIE